jgi:hypothetical protein
MEQPQPEGLERPWYYQRWFLIPTFILGWPVTFPFVFWPVWAVLVLRSPWHQHTLVKGLAWAMIIVGVALFLMNLKGENGPEYAVAIVVPGLLATVATQVMWARFRMEHGLVVRRPAPADRADEQAGPQTGPEEVSEDASTRRSRTRRRQRRQRGRRGSGRS